ncbi:MAG: hypothetical protein V1766_06530 [Pseudomonadota bacterium]
MISAKKQSEKVLPDSRDGEDVWNTIGVSEYIINVNRQVVVDGISYSLSQDNQNKDD